jgi:hypothetical protein
MEGYEGIFGAIVLGLLGVLVLGITSLVALGFLIASKTREARIAFAVGLLPTAIIAALAVLSFVEHRNGYGLGVVSALALLLVGVWQFIAALRSPRTFGPANEFDRTGIKPFRDYRACSRPDNLSSSFGIKTPASAPTVDDHIQGAASGTGVKAKVPHAGEKVQSRCGQSISVPAQGRKGEHFPEPDARQTPAPNSVAVAGLVCSLLGCAGATAGVGAGFVSLMVSATLCFLGVIFGVVALDKLRHRNGHGVAWAAILLGCLPFVQFAWRCVFPW